MRRMRVESHHPDQVAHLYLFIAIHLPSLRSGNAIRCLLPLIAHLNAVLYAKVLVSTRPMHLEFIHMRKTFPTNKFDSL
jgi:hypothetical protein